MRPLATSHSAHTGSGRGTEFLGTRIIMPKFKLYVLGAYNNSRIVDVSLNKGGFKKFTKLNPLMTSFSKKFTLLCRVQHRYLHTQQIPPPSFPPQKQPTPNYIVQYTVGIFFCIFFTYAFFQFLYNKLSHFAPLPCAGPRFPGFQPFLVGGRRGGLVVTAVYLVLLLLCGVAGGD
jgi:hypothetical protein